MNVNVNVNKEKESERWIEDGDHRSRLHRKSHIMSHLSTTHTILFLRRRWMNLVNNGWRGGFSSTQNWNIQRDNVFFSTHDHHISDHVNRSNPYLLNIYAHLYIATY